MTLANKEFTLLRTLASEPNRVFTKAELLRDVWGFRSLGTTRRYRIRAVRRRDRLTRVRRSAEDNLAAKRSPGPVGR